MRNDIRPGGSEIFRHQAPDSAEPPEFSGGDPELIEAIDNHLDGCFGDGERFVFHEIVSPTVHLDVHVVPPSDDYPVMRLVTSGMAERPMAVPDGLDITPFAELTIALPPDWPLSEGADLEDERLYWPIRLLKGLGRLPHEYSTFLWHTHTIPNGDPAEPYAPGTALCGALIAPPITAPDQFSEMQAGDRRVQILAVLPLHEDEMRFKLKRGAEALFDRFDKVGLADVVDPVRPSVVKKTRRFFG